MPGFAEFLKFKISKHKFQEVVDEAVSCAASGQRKLFVPCNVDMIVKSRTDTAFRDIMMADVVLLPDSVPLIWALRLLGDPVLERVAGSDLLIEICKAASERNLRIFFLGAAEGVAKAAAEALTRKILKLNVAGVYSPPIGFENNKEENAKITRKITESKADILFLGFGAPKQEKWIWGHKDEIYPKVSICVGGSFDMAAGRVKRAPVWVRNNGLEWFWRLCLEPRRLWKRYLTGNTIFIGLVIREYVKLKFNSEKKNFA